ASPAPSVTPAKQRKSCVSLGVAAPLFSGARDAAYVATVIAAWAERSLDAAPAASAAEPRDVMVAETRESRLQQAVTIGPHHLLADEPVKGGGLDSGPNPYEFLLAGLGACRAMTLRPSAERKGP